MMKSDFRRHQNPNGRSETRRAHISVEMRAPTTAFSTVHRMLLLAVGLFYFLFDFLVFLVVLLAVVTFAHGILLLICWPA